MYPQSTLSTWIHTREQPPWIKKWIECALQPFYFCLMYRPRSKTESDCSESPLLELTSTDRWGRTPSLFLLLTSWSQHSNSAPRTVERKFGRNTLEHRPASCVTGCVYVDKHECVCVPTSKLEVTVKNCIVWIKLMVFFTGVFKWVLFELSFSIQKTKGVFISREYSFWYTLFQLAVLTFLSHLICLIPEKLWGHFMLGISILGFLCCSLKASTNTLYKLFGYTS